MGDRLRRWMNEKDYGREGDSVRLELRQVGGFE